MLLSIWDKVGEYWVGKAVRRSRKAMLMSRKGEIELVFLTVCLVP